MVVPGNFCKSFMYAFPVSHVRYYFKFMAEYRLYHGCTIFLKTTLSKYLFIVVRPPYNLIIPNILTAGKILWRDACELWIFYLKTFSVFVLIECICMFSLILISLEVLNFEKIKQNRNPLQMCIYSILQISVSETQMVGEVLL